jgi:hypothetical protein
MKEEYFKVDEEYLRMRFRIGQLEDIPLMLWRLYMLILSYSRLALTDMNSNRSQALQLFNATAQQQVNYSALSIPLLLTVSTELSHVLKKLNVPGH